MGPLGPQDVCQRGIEWGKDGSREGPSGGRGTEGSHAVSPPHNLATACFYPYPITLSGILSRLNVILCIRWQACDVDCNFIWVLVQQCDTPVCCVAAHKTSTMFKTKDTCCPELHFAPSFEVPRYYFCYPTWKTPLNYNSNAMDINNPFCDLKLHYSDMTILKYKWGPRMNLEVYLFQICLQIVLTTLCEK